MTGWSQRCLLAAFTLAVVLVSMAGCRDDSANTESPEADLLPQEDSPPPTHGFIGLTFDSVDSIPLVIKEPVPGSPAAAVGIQEGDRLTGVANRYNPTFADIYELLVDTIPGDRLPVEISRNGENLKMELTLLSFDDVQTAMEAAKLNSSESQ